MDRGIASLLDANYEDALALFATAAVIIREVGDAKLAALIAGYELTAHASIGNVAEAKSALARGESNVAIAKDAGTRTLLEIHSAQIDLADARAKKTKTTDAIAHARAVLEKLAEPILGEHRRLGVLLLKRSIDRAEPQKKALFVTRDGSRMKPPASAWIDLAAHPSTQRVLVTLVHRRIASPGAAVRANDLIDAGWPGEKVVASAGANRLRVLLTWLRTNGLRELLRSDRGAYWLDEGTPIAVVDAAEAHD